MLKLTKTLLALSIVGMAGCTHTTQLDRYTNVKHQLNAACKYVPDDKSTKACDTVQPVKPKTSKYIYHNKNKIIANCKSDIENDVQAKAGGLQLAVNLGELSESYALSVIRVIADKAKEELKACESVPQTKLRSIRSEWKKYESDVSNYKSDNAVCLGARKKIEENAKQCEALKLKLQETEKGSYTWHYITKTEEKESFNHAVFKTVAAPIFLPVGVILDTVEMISD